MIQITYVLAFLAVVLATQAVMGLVLSGRSRNKRVNRRLTMLEAGVSREKVFEALVRRKPGGDLAQAAPRLYEQVENYFQQAGLTMSPQRFLVVLALVAVVLGALVIYLLQAATKGAMAVNLLISVCGGIGLALTGGVFTVMFLRTRRLHKLEEQLPLALEVIVRALRSGNPLVMAVKLAAEEMGDPLGSEFGLMVDETNYGLEFRQSLRNFAERAGSEYIHFFAVSVAIQAETGGNLAEILSNLNRVIRDQQTLHLKVKALASEGKASAMVLTALPILLVCFLMLTKPTFYTSKFGDPMFWPGVAGTLVMFFTGQFVINRMINFKY